MSISVVRTIDCTYTSLRFREGPVDVSGFDSMTAQIEPVDPTALASITAVVTLQGGASLSQMQPLAVPQTLTGSTPFTRAIDVSADRFVDGVITTAQSGKLLRVTIHLRKNQS